MTFQEKWDAADNASFKGGESFVACVPYMSYEPRRIHIDHVLPSIYEGRQLIIYRLYGKHKQYWHEFMCTNNDMWWYIDKVNDYKKAHS